MNKIANFVLKRNHLKNNIILSVCYFLYSYFKSPIKKVGSLNDISNRDSDTLVILGCGKSINELTENDFDRISKYDVASLSYSVVLPVKIKYYFFESPNEESDAEILEQQRKKLMPEVYKKKQKGDIENLIWKNPVHKQFEEVLGLQGFSKIWTLLIFSDDIRVFIRLVKFFKLLGLHKYCLLQKRSSLVSIVLFGVLSGYKKIIFAGIDLGDSTYYFECNEKYSSYGFLNPYSFYGVDDVPLHTTNDPAYGVTTVELIKALKDYAKDVEFKVTSAGSDLSRIMEVWSSDE